MSPFLAIYIDVIDGFPRVSGDEPVIHLAVGDANGFSPRERG